MTDDEKIEEAVKLLSGCIPARFKRRTRFFSIDINYWIDTSDLRSSYDEIFGILYEQVNCDTEKYSVTIRKLSGFEGGNLNVPSGGRYDKIPKRTFDYCVAVEFHNRSVPYGERISFSLE